MKKAANPPEIPDISHRNHSHSAFYDALLTWFDRTARPMPWRKSQDPYAIWISEIMLQQTQVQTVIPYFLRFLTRFPNVTLLAAAPLEEVLKLWAGLGYYRRAKQLHLAAKTIQATHNGLFPREYAHILALPGIGRYTAGAVGSIAFGLHVPVLDGNVMRVLSRLLTFTDDIARPAAQKKLWQIADRLLPDSRVGDFNQALMELGATLCKPVAPACAVCPIRLWCRAFADNRVEDFPHKTARKKTSIVHHVSLIIYHRRARLGNTKLVLKRPDGGLWSGLWEFPTFETRRGKVAPADITRWVLENIGLQIRILPGANYIRHQLTHRTMCYQVFTARVLGRKITTASQLPFCGPHRYESARWLKKISDVPIGRVTEKIAAVAAAKKK